MKLLRTLKRMSKAIIPTKVWRILQYLRHIQTTYQEQREFNKLLQARAIHAPSAFTPPPPTITKS